MRYNEITKYAEIFTSSYSAGKWIVDSPNNDSSEHGIQMPFVSYDKAVIEFIHAIYDSQLMDPEYLQHIKDMTIAGESLLAQPLAAVDVGDMTANEIFTLLTYVVRQERFCEGLLKHAIESGGVTKWLRRLNTINEKEQPEKCVIKTVLGDITKIDYVEAIVNAANSSLLGGGGVDGAIHRAAGKELLFECRMLNGCKTGQAKITKGYNLPCGHIIHTVGPVWNGGIKNEEGLLADCYKNALDLAVKNNIRRIAFPSISTGIYRFPVERASQIAIDTVCRFLRENENRLELVAWVLFDEHTKAVYEEELVSGIWH